MFWLVMALIMILIWFTDIGVESLIDGTGEDTDDPGSSWMEEPSHEDRA